MYEKDKRLPKIYMYERNLTGETPVIGSYQVLEGVNVYSGEIPDWYDRISRNDSATGLLQVFGTSTTASLYQESLRENFRAISTGFSQFPVGHLAVPTPDFEEAIQAAKSAWNKKLSAKMTGVLAGVTVGEAKESKQMIKDRSLAVVNKMSSYMKSTLALRKKHRIKQPGASRRMGRYLQDQNSLYLEYTYGWAPLIDEIDGWNEELRNNPFRGLKEVQNLMSKNTMRYSRSDLVQPAGVGYGLVPKWWNRETTVEQSIKYYGAHILECAENQKLDGIGLKPHNFAPTVWELIPWSFVVDYFTNIGTVILGLSLSTQRFAWTQTTTVRRTKTSLSRPQFVPYGVFTDEYDYLAKTYGAAFANDLSETVSGEASLEEFSLLRLPGTPEDMTPDIEILAPSAYQSFNVLALLTSRYRAFQRLL